MSELDQLRDLGNQIRPPTFDSLVDTARRRRRAAYAAAAIGAACFAVIVALGAGAFTGRGDDRSAQGPAGSPTNPSQSLPETSDGLFDPFDPDEPTLPGGVRVLSQDVDGFAPVEAGRHAVRVSESLLYQFDLPAYSDVFGGVYLNPGRRAGGDSIVWLTPANQRTALPVHPCRDHDPTVVGPTVDDLASALNRQPYLTTTKPVEVSVGGMEGLFVKVSVPDDADVSACQGASVDVISGTQSAEEAGIVDRLWILDIDGARHVLWARTFGATALDTSLVTRLVESITFTRD